MRIAVSARSLAMPSVCACCGSESRTSLPARATRVRGVRVVRTESGTCNVPYCGRCAGHVQRWPAVELGTVVLLTLLTLGLFLAYYLYQRQSARGGCSAACVGPGPAMSYVGWHGTRHDFQIDSPVFLRAFAGLNRKKIVWADSPAQLIMDALDAEADRTNARTSPPPPFAAPPVIPATPAPIRAQVPRTVRESESRFIGPGERAEVAGRRLDGALVYVAASTAVIDASTIVLPLPVGRGENANPLPYWPSYYEASPDQRARYLDWQASGRSDGDIEPGYMFLAFYGFERRVLVEGLDRDLIAAEIRRMLSILGRRDTSFAAYGMSLLAFLALGQMKTLDERRLDEAVGRFAGSSADALAVLLAWHAERARPLPSLHAATVAASMEGASRGVVAERAAAEIVDLFGIRYRDRCGDGLVPVAAKRSTTLEYRPASPTLVRSDVRPSATLPHVLGRPAQFKPLVDIWNSCVEDLRKLSAARRKAGADVLTTEAWAALPPELRRETEHPDRAMWESAVAAAPLIGAFHIVTAASLKRLVRCEDGEKLTAAQLRRLGETAAVLGFAIEPDPRLLGRAVSDEAEFALWRSANTACPERDVYQAAAGLLSLGLSIALADGVATEKELEVVSQLVNELVPIDDLLKQRLDALRTVLVRQPDRLATAARKLQNSRTPAERAKIGRVLVLVAAADGLLGIEEHKALRAVYRALGLTGADLDATLVECDLRLSSDATVLADAGAASQGGEAIPRPPEARAPAPAGVTLDHAAIASIMAETREVASMLAAVLGGDDGDEAPPVAAATPVSASERPPAAALPPDLQALAASLDPRYHLALRELVTKPAWNAAEVRDLGAKLKLMPGGIIEAINSWSDEHLGDYLIDEQGDWHIRVEILKRPHA